jgi:hypothetical protein
MKLFFGKKNWSKNCSLHFISKNHGKLLFDHCRTDVTHVGPETQAVPLAQIYVLNGRVGSLVVEVGSGKH